jgi:hypothetical protein
MTCSAGNHLNCKWNNRFGIQNCELFRKTFVRNALFSLGEKMSTKRCSKKNVQIKCSKSIFEKLIKIIKTDIKYTFCKLVLLEYITLHNLFHFFTNYLRKLVSLKIPFEQNYSNKIRSYFSTQAKKCQTWFSVPGAMWKPVCLMIGMSWKWCTARHISGHTWI